MIKKTTDRRIARSSASVEAAFLNLMHEKDYDAITVEDICQDANVGRSTFYTYYRGKDDLKLQGMMHLRRQLQARQAEAMRLDDQTRLAFLLPLFEHAREHRMLYRALRGGRGGMIALRALRQMLIELFDAELAAAAPGDIPRALRVQFLVGACLEILLTWLDAGAQQAPEEMAALFLQLASGCAE